VITPPGLLYLLVTTFDERLSDPKNGNTDKGDAHLPGTVEKRICYGGDERKPSKQAAKDLSTISHPSIQLA